MKGCIHITNDQLDRLLTVIDFQRDKCLVVLGIRTGFRISELLSLRFIDVLNPDGTVKDSIEVKASNCKGKRESQRVPLHIDAKDAIMQYILATETPICGNEKLFPFKRGNAHKIIKKWTRLAGIDESRGRIGTHSLRKTFAKRIHEAMGSDIMKTQIAMRHKNIDSTLKYLNVDHEEIEQAIRNVK